MFKMEPQVNWQVIELLCSRLKTENFFTLVFNLPQLNCGISDREIRYIDNPNKDQVSLSYLHFVLTSIHCSATL